MKTLRERLLDATTRLQYAGVYSPDADAAIIISAVLHVSRESLKDRLDEIPSDDIAVEIESAVTKRERRVPIARIFGRTMFRGLNIKTGDGVFEPCIETETLIEHLHIMMETSPIQHKGQLRILDIGTGTGCLLLSALNEIPHSTGVGVDIADAAIAIAKENAISSGVGARAEFRVNDWTNNINETFDVILCNPPFVPSHLIQTLVPEVMVHDPKASLDGGSDGMKFYRHLPYDFLQVAHEGSIGIFHVSMTFVEQVKRIFQKAGFGRVEICRNYYGVPMGIIVTRESYQPKQTLLSKILKLIIPKKNRLIIPAGT